MSAEQKKPYEKRSVEAGKKYEQDMAEYRKVSSSFFGGAGGVMSIYQIPRVLTGGYKYFQIQFAM